MVVVKTQTVEKYYLSFLFNRDVFVWDRLVDCSVEHQFKDKPQKYEIKVIGNATAARRVGKGSR